ncbi:MAG: AEC family transporter [Pseudomonadales bacterium]|jgi:predicted permease|nr:AEC family transporter [Pseudomonadales bacterium]
MFAMLLQLLPVFAYFGLGILLKHTKLADRSHADFLLRLVFYVCVPLLILNAVSQLELDASTALLPLSNALVNLVCLGAALLLIRGLKLAKPQAGAVAVNSAITNNSYMFPFVLAVYGQAGFAQAILYDFGNAVMMATLVYALAFRYGTQAHDAWTMLLRILRTPVIWALVLSLCLSFGGWRLPAPLVAITAPLGQMAAPLILIALGIFFSLQIKQLPLALGIVAIRMLLGLGVGLFLATLFGFEGLTYKAVVLCAGAPIGFNALTYCSLAKLDTELSASAVSISILAGMFTTPVLVYVLG